MAAFHDIELAPRDPILGLTEAFNADPSPLKVNLGVGVYSTPGQDPAAGVRPTTEQLLAAAPSPRGYLPIDGLPAYVAAVKHLVFDQDSEVVRSGRS
jgi:aromatic-amino-acid transaminase